MCKEVRTLECDMEQLVYENYAKFITATDTIKQLQTNFVSIEEQMEKLAKNMHKIGNLSDRLGGALADKHANVNKLARANRTLANLQFLFDLPTTLQSHVDRQEYKLCAEAYVRTKEALERYGRSPALSGISAECETIVDDLRKVLRQQLCAVNSGDATATGESTLISARDTAETVDCLLLLGDEPCELADIYLKRARDHLDGQLEALKGDGTQMRGVLQLANGVLSECLHVSEQRFMAATTVDDSSLLVRALDRFYRRLAATSQLLPGSVAYHTSSVAVLLRVAERQIELDVEHMVKEMNGHVKLARTQLAQTHKSLHLPVSSADPSSGGTLADVLVTLENSIVHDMKTSLGSLLQFITCDVTYVHEQRNRFVTPFALAVRDKFLLAYCQKLEQLCGEFCLGVGDKVYVNGSLILLLSRLCLNLQSSTVERLFELCHQQFHIEQAVDTSTIRDSLGCMAQRLLDRYVDMESSQLSQLLVKSVHSRDWLTCGEPRAVRAVVKRVLEDVAALDTRVAQLYNDGAHTDKSSDGSRGHHNRAPRLTTAGGGNAPSMSSINNALGKLWTERIDYVLTAQFNRQSILTCVVKMSLKTLLECVRMTTFGSLGCQQMQVDCHYLWQHMYTYCDDRQIQGILDEIVLSAEQRCPHGNTRLNPTVLDTVASRG